MSPTVFLLTRSTSNWVNTVRAATASTGSLIVIFSISELLESLANTQVDLVIIEVNPEIEEVTKLILEIKQIQKSTKVVVVASSPTWEEMLLYGQAGAVDSIQKTLDAKKLKSKLESILGPRSGEN